MKVYTIIYNDWEDWEHILTFMTLELAKAFLERKDAHIQIVSWEHREADIRYGKPPSWTGRTADGLLFGESIYELEVFYALPEPKDIL